MVKALYTLVLLLCGMSFYAQNTLYSSICDENNEVCISVTIRLLNSDSAFVKGTATDVNGHFTIEKVKPGKYILSLSSIGYVSQNIDFEMPDNNYTLPIITMQTNTVALNEVVVKGSTFIRKKDHLLVIPDKQQKKHAFSGYDLLYNLMIPGLDVNRKEKKVTAVTGEAVLYINGIKADFRDVQNLRPRDIEKVEYYVLPTTGQYIGDAASINYITKQTETGGYVNIEGEQNIGYLKGDYNLAAKIFKGNTKYTLFGGYNMQDYDGVKNEKEETLFLRDYTIQRSRTNKNADYKSNQQYSQLKIENNTEKHDLKWDLSLMRNKIPHNDSNELLEYIGHDDRKIESSDKTNNESIRPTVSFDGIFRLNDKHTLRFLANGLYSKNKYDRTYSEGSQISLTNADEDMYSFGASCRYTYMPNMQNEIYARISHDHNISSSKYGGDYESWQHLWTGETYFMVDYTHHFGEKIVTLISPSFSLYNYKLHGYELQRFFRPFMYGWIRYIVDSNQWLGVGFSIGNNNQDISFLNSIDQTIDFYQVKRGNPYLNYEKFYSYYMMYEGKIKKLNVQARVMYENKKNNIYPNYYLEENKLISSYASENSYNIFMSDISFSYAVSENVRTKCSFKYEYMNVPQETGLNQNNLAASLDINYFLKDFSINLYAKTKEKRLESSTIAYMKIPASYGASVRYNKGNLMAEIGTENPFTKNAKYYEYADYGVYRYNQTQTSRIYQQTAYLKLAYTFDFGKKTTREHRDVNTNINSAILKAR